LVWYWLAGRARLPSEAEVSSPAPSPPKDSSTATLPKSLFIESFEGV